MGEKPLIRVSLSKNLIYNLPIFLFNLGFCFIVDLRVVLEHIFICIEEISILYIKDLDFITVQTKIETQI